MARKSAVFMSVGLAALAWSLVPWGSASGRDPKRVLTGPEVYAAARAVTYRLQVDRTWDTDSQIFSGGSYASAVGFREDGWLITARHVIDDAKTILVMGEDGKLHSAERWRWSNCMDVGVVYVPGLKVKACTFADTVLPGETCYSLGFPLGADFAISQGIVSRLHGVLRVNGDFTEEIQDYVQTDTQTNPGNSGGGLFNNRGELIGLNTESLAGLERPIPGMCFATPARYSRELGEILVTEKPFSHGKLEANYSQLEGTPANELKRIGTTRTAGILVVKSSTPGLKRFDLVLAVNGESVGHWPELIARVGMLPAKSEVRLQIERQGEERELTVKLGEYR